jgi:uncharacterized protein with HEPN domain
MNNRDEQILHHIYDYCEEISDTIARFGNDYTVFHQDLDFYKSISMSLLQIGELAAKLTEEFKDATRDRMQWSLMKDMRNHFAHGYGEMDSAIIWETATKDIPSLRRFCEERFPGLGEIAP